MIAVPRRYSEIVNVFRKSKSVLLLAVVPVACLVRPHFIEQPVPLLLLYLHTLSRNYYCCRLELREVTSSRADSLFHEYHNLAILRREFFLYKLAVKN